jgi:hypothetical protein
VELVGVADDAVLAAGEDADGAVEGGVGVLVGERVPGAGAQCLLEGVVAGAAGAQGGDDGRGAVAECGVEVGAEVGGGVVEPAGGSWGWAVVGQGAAGRCDGDCGADEEQAAWAE